MSNVCEAPVRSHQSHPVLREQEPSLSVSAARRHPAGDLPHRCQTKTHGPLLYNRVLAVIEHIPWYGFRTQVRLARDSRVSEACISRLLRGECQPSLVVALQVTGAIERRLQRPLGVTELFSLDGSFPTASVCRLVGCSNCLPECCYDEEDNLKTDYQVIQPGQWAWVQPLLTGLSRPVQPLPGALSKEAA
ncbi:MAG: hypothetical protein JOZ57_08970 [Abitibacteriaceae bacterium]|nr:hypothetical protein [Abditibacteriaceae bacterium]